MFSVTSLGFLPFMALFACLWYRVPQPSRWKLVLAANAVFCLSIDIGAFFAVALATAVVWQAAQHAQPEQPSRRGWLALGLAAALLPLLVLKYSGMLVPGLRDLYKPCGLAYYSLQLAGYLLDVGHGRTAPTPSYARLWCYAGFFLSLTQGPFNRYNTLMPQLEAAPKTFETQRLVSGLQRSAWGYFKKFAIADRAAIVVSAAFADPASFDRSQLIFATVMYSFQLYADFSGYTDIVLGMGEILGLHLPENFRQPFFSASVKELWARWHISLSQWFRDYVYIPLGGNRKGIARRDANLLLTFLVSGLWHGANWTFLVWGGLHGLCQVAEDHMPAPLRKRKSLPLRIVGVPLTFAIFVTTFTIFRTSSLGNAAAYFAGILHNPGHEVFAQYWLLGLTSKLELLLLLLGIALLVLVDVLHECGLHLRAWVNAAPRPVRWAVYEFAIFAFLLMASFYSNTGFLYARF